MGRKATDIVSTVSKNLESLYIVKDGKENEESNKRSDISRSLFILGLFIYNN